MEVLPQSYPLSFLSSGGYYCSRGALVNQNTDGNYWSLRGYTSGTNLNANYLSFSYTHVYPQNGTIRGYGYALRCLAR